jgi:hypothetical protein
MMMMITNKLTRLLLLFSKKQIAASLHQVESLLLSITVEKMS